MLKRLAIYVDVSPVRNYKFQLFRVVYMMLSSLNNYVGDLFILICRKELHFRAILTIKVHALPTTNITKRIRKRVQYQSSLLTEMAFVTNRPKTKENRLVVTVKPRNVRKSRGAE